MTLGRTRIVLGEVLALSIAEKHMQDAEKHYVDTPSLDLIGRMGGRGGYATTRDAFEIARLSYPQWLAGEATMTCAPPRWATPPPWPAFTRRAGPRRTGG